MRIHMTDRRPRTIFFSSMAEEFPKLEHRLLKLQPENNSYEKRYLNQSTVNSCRLAIIIII